MRESLMSIGDDYWTEDDSGQRAFKVDGKAIRVRDTFVLRDAEGHEAAKNQERKARVRDTMEIERDGNTVATVSKRWFRLREPYGVEVEPGQDDAMILAIAVCVDARSGE
jgi:uncharacterized protein YxjI